MNAKKRPSLADELMHDLLGDSSDSQPAAIEPSGVIDATMRIEEADPVVPSTWAATAASTPAQTAIGRGARPPGGVVGDVSLAQAETLRIAQQRIHDLEDELAKRRLQAEELTAAAEAFKNRFDKMLAEIEKLKRLRHDEKANFVEEREVLSSALKEKERELQNLRLKNEEYEMRLSSNIQKIRVRERELENRLELIRMESAAVMRNKDELILDLKRQLDQVRLEIENYRQRSQELHRQLNGKNEIQYRLLKTLRLALTMLEGAERDNTERTEEDGE